MVKKRRTTKVPAGCKPTKALRAKYKKCILTAIRGTKITTRKGAQKAFNRASKKCRVLLSGVAPRRGKKRGRKKGTSRLRVPGMRYNKRRRMGSRVSDLMAYAGGRPFYQGSTF